MEEVQDSISETECSERLGAPVKKIEKKIGKRTPPVVQRMGETKKEIRKKDLPVVLKMGEKTDLQGQKLYVVLFVLSIVCRTGERYLNLETAKKGILNLKYGPKDMMFWK